MASTQEAPTPTTGEGEGENRPLSLSPLPAFKPDLYERAWQSVPHPTLPLLATAHQKSVTVFSLSTLSAHSALTGGHTRSVRGVAWKPGLPPGRLCLVTGSFDSTAAIWRWGGEGGEGGSDDDDDDGGNDNGLEVEVKGTGSDSGDGEKEWEFILVMEGHDSEIKSVAFSPAGQYVATCGRDKAIWVWEDVGTSEADDEWETVAVLNEHDGDVKCVAWCPELPPAVTERGRRGGRRQYSADVFASASYDDTVRVWRQDEDGEWVCVAVLEGHTGTVWGVQWEPPLRRPHRLDDPSSSRFPRLLTWSADRTVRVWTLKEDDEEEGGAPHQEMHSWGGLGGSIPNTMRRSLKEDWECTATLPAAHARDIYSASWSAETGLVASTGSDGVVAVYAEERSVAGSSGDDDAAATAELDGDIPMTNGHPEEIPTNRPSSSCSWKLLATIPNAHGPYEVNHVTWCKRYDPGCPPERRGVEEMLVTTGDDGVVRPWQVSRP